MSINLIPGYDFTPYEIVTTEKLRKWIAGVYNSASLAAADIGLSEDDTGIGLFTTATWATTVSPGALTLNTTTGWVTVSTKWGHVPIFGTQGGLFSMRLKEGESAMASFDRFYEGGLPNMVGVKAAHTPTLPASSYSAGEGYDLFGANSINVGAAFMGASDISAHRASKTFARYPSANSFNDAGAWTVATYVTGASFVHSLYKLGGYQTLRYKMQNGGAVVASAITHVGDWAPGGLTQNSRLAVDSDNNLVFDGGRTEGVRSFYILNASTHSLVSQNDTAGEGAGSFGVAFDTSRRLLYSVSEGGDGFSVFEVDTAGNITFLANDSSPDTAAGDVVFTGNHVYTASGAGVMFYDTTIATNPTLIQTHDPGTPMLLALCRDNSFLVTTNEDGNRLWYVYSRGTGGTLSYLGQNDIASDSFQLLSDNNDDSLIWDGSQGSYNAQILEINSSGTLSQVKRLGYGMQSISLFGDYILTVQGSSVAVFNKSIVTNISLVYDKQLNGPRTIAMANDNLIVTTDYFDSTFDFFDWTTTGGGVGTGVSGVRGYSDGVLWDIISDSHSAVSGPMRVTPSAQCFYYYGAKQLSGGYVIPLLSVNEFTLGGSEF